MGIPLNLNPLEQSFQKIADNNTSLKEVYVSYRDQGKSVRESSELW
jgi:hypothetical protein